MLGGPESELEGTGAAIAIILRADHHWVRAAQTEGRLRAAVPSRLVPQEASRLRLQLIGQMAAQNEQGPVALPRVRKTRALLAILVMAGPRPVLRERITALLWSRREREQARASLRQCVHELQEMCAALGLPPLQTGRQHLQLNAEHIWADIEALGAPNAGPPGELLEDLVGLDPAFDQWLATESRRLREAVASPLLLHANAMPEPEMLPAQHPVSAPRRRPDGVWLGVAMFRSTDQPDAALLSMGLAEEITTALGRFRWINLIAPGSIAALAHEPTRQSERWRELDLDFLLDGAIQCSAGQIRVTVRLLDQRAGGEVVWSHRFDRPAADLLTLQDDIAAETAAQVDPELMRHESRRAAERPLRDASAYELMLRAIPAIYHLVKPEYDEAGLLLARAAALAPDSAAIMGWWACWHVYLVGQGWAPDPAAAMQRAGALAERAVTLDPSCARALSIAAYVRSFLLHKDISETISLHERALALNPNLPFAWAVAALSLAYAGEHATALERAHQAKRLSPFDPHSFFFDNALMVPSLMLRQFDTVVMLGRRAMALNPSMSGTMKGLLSALGHLGRGAEAAELRETLLLLVPGFSLARAAKRSPLRRAEDRQIYIEGLRLAGLPEE